MGRVCVEVETVASVKSVLILMQIKVWLWNLVLEMESCTSGHIITHHYLPLLSSLLLGHLLGEQISTLCISFNLESFNLIRTFNFRFAVNGL